jgi:hypothetical protein
MIKVACIQPITSYQTAGIRKRCSIPQIATPLASVGQTFVTRTAGYLVEIVLHLKIFYTGTSSFSVASIALWVYKAVTCLYFCYVCEQAEHPPHHYVACQDDKSLSKPARNRLGRAAPRRARVPAHVVRTQSEMTLRATSVDSWQAAPVSGAGTCLSKRVV